ncbi:MAG: metalloregulator ArsR/SmtB family transcription factor [Cyclobacteriaceae bacterium]
MTKKEKQHIWKLIANENRREIIMLLAESSKRVIELEKCLNLSQSSISQHLKRLKAVGLVGVEQRSKTKVFMLLPEKIREVLSDLQLAQNPQKG